MPPHTSLLSLLQRAAPDLTLTHPTMPLPLYGGSLPWSPTDWTAQDDRLRGGISQSYLDTTPGTPYAIFRGNLDITQLGGAGFASQRTTTENVWDLSAYGGLLITVAASGQNESEGANGVGNETVAGSDGKRYTFVVKDEANVDREGVNSTLSWEGEFVVPSIADSTNESNPTTTLADEKLPLPSPESGLQGTQILLRWADLKAMYRGRAQPDAAPLNLERVARFSIMMRSYFGGQEGEFRLVVRSIAAVVVDQVANANTTITVARRAKREAVEEKREAEGAERRIAKREQGWLSWVANGCGMM